MNIIQQLLIVSCLSCPMIALADSPPVIINNNANQPANTQPSNTQGCNNQSSVDPNAQRPGTYYQSNPNGGTDTIYTTGDKTPYNADINCNNNSTPVTVQPYVYAPLPPKH